jgi:hypothetical protein
MVSYYICFSYKTLWRKLQALFAPVRANWAHGCRDHAAVRNHEMEKQDYASEWTAEEHKICLEDHSPGKIRPLQIELLDLVADLPLGQA